MVCEQSSSMQNNDELSMVNQFSTSEAENVDTSFTTTDSSEMVVDSSFTTIDSSFMTESSADLNSSHLSSSTAGYQPDLDISGENENIIEEEDDDGSLVSIDMEDRRHWEVCPRVQTKGQLNPIWNHFLVYKDKPSFSIAVCKYCYEEKDNLLRAVESWEVPCNKYFRNLKPLERHLLHVHPITNARFDNLFTPRCKLPKHKSLVVVPETNSIVTINNNNTTESTIDDNLPFPVKKRAKMMQTTVNFINDSRDDKITLPALIHVEAAVPVDVDTENTPPKSNQLPVSNNPNKRRRKSSLTSELQMAL
jgi:hypothetical protein